MTRTTGLFVALAIALAGAPVSDAAASGGTVSTLFAGSLLNYMEHNFGPSFAKATDYGYRGFGGGSTEVAAQIKGDVRQGDVFISASSAADNLLEGSANGDWVSWYTTFASSPLMLAYDPSSSFGKQLAQGRPWYRVITEPGILVGRTDPELDPKGILTVEAVEGAARKLRQPALTQALGSFPVYPETALVGRLQAGQLDAGFFYAVEASSAHLVTVPLTPVYKYANYTVTILNRAANPTGAAALVRYLLNAQRRFTLKKNGLVTLTPQFSGRRSAVPTSLRKLVGASR
ncbi:MAG TPA: substrate-binding domain-containing protein [Solirubrobacteraceae bacterium]|nr:substrate-binding domain-containing protein [Solirubrobacteraceae bacterium]